MSRLGGLLGRLWAILGASEVVLNGAKSQEANMLKMYVIRKEWGDFCLSGPSWETSWRGLEASWRPLGPLETPREPSETPGGRLEGGSRLSGAAVRPVGPLSGAILGPPGAGLAPGPHICGRGRGPRAPGPGPPLYVYIYTHTHTHTCAADNELKLVTEGLRKALKFVNPDI